MPGTMVVKVEEGCGVYFNGSVRQSGNQGTSRQPDHSDLHRQQLRQGVGPLGLHLLDPGAEGGTAVMLVMVGTCQ